jgi:hypothetical protein
MVWQEHQMHVIHGIFFSKCGNALLSAPSEPAGGIRKKGGAEISVFNGIPYNPDRGGRKKKSYR